MGANKLLDLSVPAPLLSFVNFKDFDSNFPDSSTREASCLCLAISIPQISISNHLGLNLR
jgi:hypothetical protein